MAKYRIYRDIERLWLYTPSGSVVLLGKWPTENLGTKELRKLVRFANKQLKEARHGK